MSSVIQTTRRKPAMSDIRSRGSICNVASDAQPMSWIRERLAVKTGEQPTDTAASGVSVPESHAVPQHILVVDDEELIRRTLSLFLTRAGFSAVAVNSGTEAIELLRAEDGKEFELLVTDQSMPGMTGCELIEEVAQLRPGLPVLLITGYNMTEGFGHLPQGIPTLNKPFDWATFINQVQALLGQSEKFRAFPA